MRRFLLGTVVLMSCRFNSSWQLGGRSGSTSSPPPSAQPAAGPEPTAKTEPTEPAKAGSKVDGSSSGAYHRPVKEETWQVATLATEPTRPRASNSFDGEYLMWPSGECEPASIKASGPDVQTNAIVRIWRNAGFVCPATCENPVPVTIKNGVASVVLAWQRDDWSDEKAVTYERTRVDVPLFKLPAKGASKEGVRGRSRSAMPTRTWNDTDAFTHTSNMFDVGIEIVRTDDETSGHGRSGVLFVNTGKDGKFYAPEQSRAPNCEASVMQRGFVFAKQPDVEDGGDDDSGPSTTSVDRGARRDEQRAATAKRKCRAQCKLDAGECRKGSSGAKAANACNKAERSCESSC